MRFAVAVCCSVPEPSSDAPRLSWLLQGHGEGNYDSSPEHVLFVSPSQFPLPSTYKCLSLVACPAPAHSPLSRSPCPGTRLATLTTWHHRPTLAISTFISCLHCQDSRRTRSARGGWSAQALAADMTSPPGLRACCRWDAGCGSIGRGRHPQPYSRLQICSRNRSSRPVYSAKGADQNAEDHHSNSQPASIMTLPPNNASNGPKDFPRTPTTLKLATSAIRPSRF